MRIIFPSLLYCEAIDKVEIPALSERHESLSITGKLFEDIVNYCNEHHKMGNLLPSMASSHARHLRNKRRFTVIPQFVAVWTLYYKLCDVNNL